MTMRIESENRRTGETEKKHGGDDQKQRETARKPIRHFRDLEVYQNALETGLRVYELSKKFPDEERYAQPIRFVDRRAPSAQILRRRGASDVTLRLSFPS